MGLGFGMIPDAPRRRGFEKKGESRRDSKLGDRASITPVPQVTSKYRARPTRAKKDILRDRITIMRKWKRKQSDLPFASDGVTPSSKTRIYSRLKTASIASRGKKSVPIREQNIGNVLLLSRNQSVLRQSGKWMLNLVVLHPITRRPRQRRIGPRCIA